MSIGVVGTRRVKDGLYVQVSLGGDATDCTLAAHVAVADGREVPVRVLRGEDEGDWLLALAALSVTQVVTLAAIAWDGSTTEEVTQKFNPLASRLPSPVETLRRRSSKGVVRVPSARDALGEWEVWADRLISTREGIDICQGHTTLTGAGRDSVEGPLAVRALDARGRDACDGAWVCLSDEVSPLAEHPGFFVRRVEFSVRVPEAVSTLVLWVRPEGEGDLPAGFACLGPRVTARIRELWRSATLAAADDGGYDDWYINKHAAPQAELSMQQDGSFERGASFSVVAVLQGASPERLREMVDSVLEQSYGHLELVLVNAAPDDQRLASAVRGMELADARVRCVPLGADFGIAAATSEGIDAATGDFLCLLSEGDTLAPDALWCLARAIEENPTADVLYTDEDRIDGGRHVAPLFKPGWDPDLLMGSYYLGNLLAVRTELLHDMETMGRELDGAQAYHVALYASERARSVCHVPRVLYHAQGPEAGAAGASVTAAGLLALRRHIEAKGLAASVRASTRVRQGYEVSYELPDEQPLVSVIIVNRDGIASLDRCLTSLREHTDYENYEVIVVEHESSDPATFDYYRQAEEADERVRTIFYQGDGASNHACLVNFGASRAKGAYLVLLAPDVEVTDAAWLGRLVSLCAREGTGAAGARLVRADGTIAFTGGFLSSHGPVALDRYRAASDCDRPGDALLHAVTLASGWCLAVDAMAWRKLGGILVAYAGRYGDDDLCLRLARNGYRVVLDPQVTLVTHRSCADDGLVRKDAPDLEAMGRLWGSWPYGFSATDPTIGPNVSHLSAYRILRS